MKLVAAVDQGDGNLNAVGCGGVDAFACIEVAIEAAGNFLLLQQDRFAGFQIVFVDGTGGDEGLVAVAESGCFPNAIDTG